MATTTETAGETVSHNKFSKSLPPATTIDPYRDDVRVAREGGMTVVAHSDEGEATGTYTVKPDEADEEYHVDMRDGSCSCSDAGVCEHRRRVALSITYAGLPATGDDIKGGEQ
jgi:hypothetical protein